MVKCEVLKLKMILEYSSCIMCICFAIIFADRNDALPPANKTKCSQDSGVSWEDLQPQMANLTGKEPVNHRNAWKDGKILRFAWTGKLIRPYKFYIPTCV